MKKNGNDNTYAYILINVDGKLALHAPNSKAKPLFVDFTSKKLMSRINNSKKFQEPLAKALGIKPKLTLEILDATAGLGVDSFVMAALGAKVTLLERNDMVFKLLEDGFKRASESPDQKLKEITARMTLLKGDAITLIPQLAKDVPFDIIYLDPMFPDTEHNSALPKKELMALRQIIGEYDQSDSDKLLYLVLQYTNNKVVVKRHKLSPYLQNQKPHHSITSKTNRFDVYYK